MRFFALNTLRRSLSAAFLLFLVSCSHQATTKSVNRVDSAPLEMKAVDFIFYRARFSGDAETLKAMSRLGNYNDSAYPENFKRHVKGAFKANGIAANVIVVEGQGNAVKPLADYYILVFPKTLKVSTQLPHGTRFYSIQVDMSLYKKGVPQPVWTGERFFDIDSDETRVGNWVLGILNALHSSQVIVLPQGHAVTPGGSRNYMSDGRGK